MTIPGQQETMRTTVDEISLIDLLEAGFCRSRETVNVLMECIVDTCLCGLLFWAFGFAFMFGHGNGWIGWGADKGPNGFACFRHGQQAAQLLDGDFVVDARTSRLHLDRASGQLNDLG